MTARTMLERLRWKVQANWDAELAREIGLNRSEVCKILRGVHAKCDGMRLSTLRTISEHTGMPISMLADWWAESEADGMAAVEKSKQLG